MRKIFFLLAAVAGGALTGLLLNAINVYLSPIYFDICVRPTYFAIGSGFDALLIGMRDGALAGPGGRPADSGILPGFSLDSACRACWKRRGRISDRGEIGVLYAHLDTETFRNIFLAVPEEPELLRQYARAGGSIPGMLYGVLLGTFGCIAFELDRRHDTLPPRSRKIYALLWVFGGVAGLHWLYIGRWPLAVFQVVFSCFFFYGGSVSLISFFFFLLLAFLGLLPKKDRWGHPMSHARTGNWIQGIAVALLFFYSMIPFPCYARPKALEMSCRNQLRLIYIAIENYRSDHDVHPSGPEVLSLESGAFRCPGRSGRAYQFLSPPSGKEELYPMVYDSIEAPHPGGTLVLWSDGVISSYHGKRYRGSFRDEKDLYDTIMKRKDSAP